MKRRGSSQSTTGHVEPGGNTGGPPSKPKYYLMTDSEQYCEGMVKRTPGGEWKEPETLCLQADKALLMCDIVLFVERSGERMYAARLRY